MCRFAKWIKRHGIREAKELDMLFAYNNLRAGRKISPKNLFDFVDVPENNMTEFFCTMYSVVNYEI